MLFASIDYRPLVAVDGDARYDYKAELKTSTPLKIVVNPVVMRKVPHTSRHRPPRCPL
jgi:hypothetical protein